MVKQEYNDPQIKKQEELVIKLFQQKETLSVYPTGENYKKAVKMHKKAENELNRMKENFISPVPQKKSNVEKVEQKVDKTTSERELNAQEELVIKLFQQKEAHSSYQMGENFKKAFKIHEKAENELNRMKENYKKAVKMHEKATQQLEKMKSNAKLVLNKATKEEVEKKRSRVDVSQNNIKEENDQKLSKVQEVQQESKSQSTPEKTTVQIYPPELEKQINEKKDELGKFIKKHDHIIKNLRAQHMELKYKDDEIKKVWPKFDKAKESVASFKQEAASLSDDLKKKTGSTF